MNGSAKEILVKKTQTVEGKSNDYKSIFLFLVEQNILCINFGKKNLRARKKIFIRNYNANTIQEL